MAKTAQDVLRQIKDDGIELIDLKFTDLHGKWQHLTVCADMVDEEAFSEGLAFDGSSIRASKAAAGAGKKGATKSPKTTLWAAREADSAARSTWLLTATACPLPLMSPPDRDTNRRSSKRS